MSAAPIGSELVEGATLGSATLVRPLGSGRRFEVWLGKSVGVEGFERELCIKFLRLDPDVAAHSGERFLAAAQRAVALKHASILQVLDVGCLVSSAGPRPYVVTEVARGISFEALLGAPSANAVPLAARVYVVAEVVRALEYVHRARSAHGALTAKRVFVSARSEVKTTDFALFAALAPDAQSDALQLDRDAVADLLERVDLDRSSEALSAVTARLREPDGLDWADAYESLHALTWALAERPSDREPGGWVLEALARETDAYASPSAPSPLPQTSEPDTSEADPASLGRARG
jgi:serine/threonine protein kinase